MKVVLFSPPAANPLTGGHLYNQHLRLEHRRVEPSALMSVLSLLPQETVVLLDSLYLPVFRPGRPQVFFLLHSFKGELPAVDGFVVPSERLAVPGRVVVCPPGLDGRYRAPPPVKVHGQPPRIVTVANVQRGKGVLELFDAFLEAQQAVPGWQWHLIGDLMVEPETTAQLRTRIARHALKDRVLLKGVQPPEVVFEELGKAQLFALLSHQETFGMALREAVARGLPCVVSPAGEASSWVTSGVSGYVCSTLAEATDALRALMTDDALRARMVEQAWKGRPPFRSWDEVSHELLVGLASLVAQ